MTTFDLSELGDRAADVAARLKLGGEITLTAGGRVVGRFVPTPAVNRPRVLGLGAGDGTFRLPPDFDDPLPDAFWLGGDA